MLTQNTLKTKLKKGELCLGSVLPFASPTFAELLARCGSDAIIFDSEHGSLDISQIEDLTRACELGGATPVCRVPAARPEIILRTMDAGVMGVIVPHVKTQEIAEAIVSYVKYPPVGQRGLAMTIRAAGYLGMGVNEYLFAGLSATNGIRFLEAVIKGGKVIAGSRSKVHGLLLERV